MDLVKLLNAIDVVAYRPVLNEHTGGVTATILFQQVLFRFMNNKFKAFYKFKSPCKAPLYKHGDSWTEELGFTIAEFDSAVKKLKARDLITTKVDANRLTWYSINIDVAIDLLVKVQPKDTKPQTQTKVKPTRVKPVLPDTTSKKHDDEVFRYVLPKTDTNPALIEAKVDTVQPIKPSIPTKIEPPIIYNASELANLAIDVFNWLKINPTPDYQFENAFNIVKHFQATGLNNNPLYKAYLQQHY